MAGKHNSLQRLVVFMLAILLCLSAAGCEGLETPRHAAVQADPQIKTATVASGSINMVLSGNGSLKPARAVSLYYTSLSGPLVRLMVKQGDTVKKGQAIAVINPLDINDRINDQRLLLRRWPIRMAQLKEGVESARATQDRLKWELQTAQSVPQSVYNSPDIQRLKLQYESAASAYRNAQWNKELAQIDYARDVQAMKKLKTLESQKALRTPVDGIAVFVESLSENEMIVPSRVIARIAALNNTAFQMTCESGRYLYGVDRAVLTIDNIDYPVQIYKPQPGDQLTVAGNENNPNLIHMKFIGVAPPLKINEKVQASLRIEKKEALLIPESAQREEDGKCVVDVLFGNEIQTVQIVRGLAMGDRIEVVAGLTEGQRVLIGAE